MSKELSRAALSLTGHANVYEPDREAATFAAGDDRVLLAAVNLYFDTLGRARAAFDYKYGPGLAPGNEAGEPRVIDGVPLARVVAEMLGRPLPILGAFADGGLIGKNEQGVGSRLGGTYGFCFVDIAGRRCYEQAGYVTLAEAAGIGGPEIPGSGVTNNLSELVAFLRMLKALPPGFSGPVFSDSSCTLSRVFNYSDKTRAKMLETTPLKLVDYIPVLRARLGRLEPVLLAGHADERPGDLERGYSEETNKEGVTRTLPNSIHNVWCDKAAGKVKARYLEIFPPEARPENARNDAQAARTGPRAPEPPPSRPVFKSPLSPPRARPEIYTPEAGAITTI